jgi:hypothetical protein
MTCHNDAVIPAALKEGVIEPLTRFVGSFSG